MMINNIILRDREGAARLFLSFLAGFLFLSSSLLAKENTTVTKPVMIELFTSQGCSSCPKADKVFEKLAKRKDVIALGFHVDYWDYLGWKDKMASPVNSKRQRDYARMRGDNSVFTPQVIVAGQTSLIGQYEAEIIKAIENHAKNQDKAIEVNLTENEKSLFIEIGGIKPGQPKEEGTVWLALIKKHQKVKIKRGENRGKTITYHNIVHELSPVGRWMGKKMKIRLPRQHWMQRGSDGCVIFLQKDGDKGQIRGAAQIISW